MFASLLDYEGNSDFNFYDSRKKMQTQNVWQLNPNLQFHGFEKMNFKILEHIASFFEPFFLIGLMRSSFFIRIMIVIIFDWTSQVS